MKIFSIGRAVANLSVAMIQQKHINQRESALWAAIGHVFLIFGHDASPWFAKWMQDSGRPHDPAKTSMSILSAIHYETAKPLSALGDISPPSAMKKRDARTGETPTKDRMCGESHSAWIRLDLFISLNLDGANNPQGGICTSMNLLCRHL